MIDIESLEKQAVQGLVWQTLVTNHYNYSSRNGKLEMQEQKNKNGWQF